MNETLHENPKVQRLRKMYSRPPSDEEIMVILDEELMAVRSQLARAKMHLADIVSAHNASSNHAGGLSELRKSIQVAGAEYGWVTE